MFGTMGGQNMCYECVEGYTLNTADPNANGCYVGCLVANCKSCYPVSNSNCETCLEGFYSNATQKCIKCAVENCKFCTELRCFECFIGYQLAPNGTVCLEYQCKDDLVFNGFACSCPDGTFYSDTKCVPCLQSNCRWCSIDGCVECMNGYYKSEDICKSCMANCKQCTNDTNCQMCAENYFL